MKALVVHGSTNFEDSTIEAVAFVNDDAPELQPEALGQLVADCAEVNLSVRVITVDTVGNIIEAYRHAAAGAKAARAADEGRRASRPEGTPRRRGRARSPREARAMSEELAAWLVAGLLALFGMARGVERRLADPAWRARRLKKP